MDAMRKHSSWRNNSKKYSQWLWYYYYKFYSSYRIAATTSLHVTYFDERSMSAMSVMSVMSAMSVVSVMSAMSAMSAMIVVSVMSVMSGWPSKQSPADLCWRLLRLCFFLDIISYYVMLCYIMLYYIIQENSCHDVCSAIHVQVYIDRRRIHVMPWCSGIQHRPCRCLCRFGSDCSARGWFCTFGHMTIQ